MKNIADLLPALTRVFDGLEKGDIQPAVASQMSNAIGKMIAAAKAQTEYQRLRGEVPEIDFLNRKES